jgi:hypothetical protein
MQKAVRSIAGQCRKDRTDKKKKNYQKSSNAHLILPNQTQKLGPYNASLTTLVSKQALGKP